MIKSSRKYFVLALLLAMLAMGFSPTRSSAAQPPCIPAWYEDRIVPFTVTNQIIDEKGKPGKNVAIPFYVFGPPGAAPQFEVLSEIPGEAGYSPFWEVIVVIPTNGRDVSTHPFTSEDEILAARDAGDVILIDTGFSFLCQVLPSCSH